MRRNFLLLIVTFLLLTLTSCQKVSLHDGIEAITVVNKFLKLNLEGQYQDAYKFFDIGFTDKVPFNTFENKNSLNKNPILGKMKKAEFKYFMLIGAQNNIELIYDCDFEKLSGVPLHFILSGSQLDGYKITVIDVGYNYKVFGDDEEKRPRLTVEGAYVVVS